METVSVNQEKRLNTSKAAIPLLWVSIVSMVMVFGSLTSGYIVSRGGGNWLHFELPQLFYVSTAIILMSSVTMNWTLASAKKNDLKNIKIASFLTLLLGILFVVFQVKAWGYLVEQQIFFTGKTSSGSGSYLYVLTGLHIAHLVFGMIALTVVWIKSLQNKYYVEKEVLEGIHNLKQKIKDLRKGKNLEEAEYRLIELDNKMASNLDGIEARHQNISQKINDLKGNELAEAESKLEEFESKMGASLLGIRLCAIFWHFLDVLWIFLFLFLLFVR